jgi:hypothetical protein
MKNSPQRFPRTPSEFEDFDDFLENHLIFGFAPSEAVFSKDDIIVSIGSCFAGNISKALEDHGLKNTVHFDIAETNNSILALARFLKLIVDGEPTDTQRDWIDKFVRNSDLKSSRAALEQARCIIMTLGVSVAGYDEHGFPSNVSMKNASLIEPDTNLRGIKEAVGAIRSVNPEVPVVLTVSPVPLAGSPFPKFNAFAVDCVSKSFLRTAVHYAMRHIDNVHYWPSFEAVRWYSGHADIKFGDADGNARHIDPALIAKITECFIRHYCKSD